MPIILDAEAMLVADGWIEFWRYLTVFLAKKFKWIKRVDWFNHFSKQGGIIEIHTTTKILMFGWLTPPIAVITAVFVLVIYANNGLINETGYWVIQLDEFITLNAFLGHYSNSLWSNLTLLGDAGVLLPLLSVFLLVRPNTWAAIFGAVPLATLFTQLGKNYWSIPRPGGVMEETDFSVIGNLLAGTNSLPSGHSLTIFAATIAVLAILVPRIRSATDWCIVLIGIFIAAVICASRVAVGAHWPFDLLLGGAMGWISGLSGAFLVTRYRNWWCVPLYSKGSYGISALLALLSFHLISRALDAPEGMLMLCVAAFTGLFTSLCLIGQRLFVWEPINVHVT